MKPLRLAVLISGSGTNLQAILDNIENTDLAVSVQLVVSNNPAAYGLVRAEKAGIDTQVIDHRRYANRLDFDRAVHASLEANQVEVVLLAGFMRILSDWFVNQWQGRMINIHPSLLPDFKGLDTHRRVLEAGDRRHGATVHVVTPELDAGPILLQGSIDVGKGEDVHSLEQRVHGVEYRIYPEVVSWLGCGRLRLTTQGAYLDDIELSETGVMVHYADI